MNALLETRVRRISRCDGGAAFATSKRGVAEAFTTYLPGNNQNENYVTALMEDSGGRIWCGTGGGLFEMLSDHTFRRQRLPAPRSHDRIEQ